MSEILGGLCLRDVLEGGAVFEVNYDAPAEDEETKEKECIEAFQEYLKLECLDHGNLHDGSEPFDNIAKRMINILPDGKIKKRVIRDGYGAKPEKNSRVYINYNAYVQFEAQPFDSTYARKKSFSFIIGEGQVIEGLEIAVQSMQLNEKSAFLIHSTLAFHNSGIQRIPPGSDVLFEVELHETKLCTAEDFSGNKKKTFEDVHKECLAHSLQGKTKFKLKDLHGAIKEYKIAIEKLEASELKDYDEQLKCEEFLVQLYTNLLVSYTKAKVPKRGCTAAQQIYQMSRNNTFKVSTKVYFNHGKCIAMLGDFARAEQKLKKALWLEPGNAEIKQELDSLRERKNEYKKVETNLGKALLKS